MEHLPDTQTPDPPETDPAHPASPESDWMREYTLPPNFFDGLMRLEDALDLLSTLDGHGPATTFSSYTRGRVRRTPTGQWAADAGWAGTTQPLGEFPTEADAGAAVGAAIEATWHTLHDWLLTHVTGPWRLARETLTLDVVDGLTAAQVAERRGITVSTWRAYVSRGQAPAPDGHTDRGNPWWLAETIDTWNRPGTGARTDLTGPR